MQMENILHLESKLENLAFQFKRRKEKVNNSDIAEYIGAPLNTVTGVINRLEKKGLVERLRDKEDKRVVNIILTDIGKALVNEQKDEILFYFKKIYEALDDTERSTLINIIGKILPILKGADIKEKSTSGKKIRKIEIE